MLNCESLSPKADGVCRVKSDSSDDVTSAGVSGGKGVMQTNSGAEFRHISVESVKRRCPSEDETTVKKCRVGTQYTKFILPKQFAPPIPLFWDGILSESTACEVDIMASHQGINYLNWCKRRMTSVKLLMGFIKAHHRTDHDFIDDDDEYEVEYDATQYKNTADDVRAGTSHLYNISDDEDDIDPDEQPYYSCSLANLGMTLQNFA